MKTRGRKKAGKPVCPVETTIDVLHGKWKGAILQYLLSSGRQRFHAILSYCSGTTQRMLAKQLRELEKCGLISRTVYAEVPSRVEYELTTLGKSLAPILHSMHNWGKKYDAKHPVHQRA